MQCCFVGPHAILASAVAAFLVASPVFAATPQIPPTGSAPPSITLTPELRGDLAMAHREYLAAVEAYRDDPHPDAQLWNKMGMAYHHLFAMDQARRDYERALHLRPKYPEALNNLGAVYYAKRQYRKAVRYYRKAIHINPKSAPIYSNLGTAYFAQRKVKKGLEAYRRAYSIDPEVFSGDAPQLVSESLPARERAEEDYCLAQLFAQAGHYKQAMEYLRRALDEGFADRKSILQDQMFAALRTRPEFAQLLAEEKIR